MNKKTDKPDLITKFLLIIFTVLVATETIAKILHYGE